MSLTQTEADNSYVIDTFESSNYIWHLWNEKKYPENFYILFI